MRIVQLSDLHISAENDFPNGVDVRSNFLRALEAIPEYEPDFLVISGDLTYRQGNNDIYQWIQRQLRSLGVRVYVIAGNHDDSVLLAETFHPEKKTSSSGKLYYFSKKMEELLLFLDTADGTLGKTQFRWVEETLEQFHPNRLIVFMHHPPVLADVPHMDDQYAFRDIPEFSRLAEQFGRPMFIFTGHYHIRKSIHEANRHVFIAPSTFFHLKGDRSDFARDHIKPGFQVIDLGAGKVSVHTHYVGME
jgi:Icc protein